MQILFAMLFVYLLFFGVDRTENDIVCSIVGILLQNMSLTVFCLFVFATISVLYTCIDKWNSTVSIIILSVLSWSKSIIFKLIFDYHH